MATRLQVKQLSFVTDIRETRLQLLLTEAIVALEIAEFELEASGKLVAQRRQDAASADIDFARDEALLPYGIIGVKVWIYKGEVFDRSKISNIETTEAKTQFLDDRNQKHYSRRRQPATKHAVNKEIADEATR